MSDIILDDLDAEQYRKFYEDICSNNYDEDDIQPIITKLSKSVIRNYVVGIKAKGCQTCGYNRYVGALEFHHYDKNSKLFSICSCYDKSMDDIKKEIKKCIVVCSNCHREIHSRHVDI